MANPYESPTPVAQDPNFIPQQQLNSQATGLRWMQRIIGAVSLCISLAMVGYSILILYLINGTSQPIPWNVIVLLIGLIFFFGVGWGLLGIGLLMRRTRWAWYGGATAIITLMTYILVAMTFV